MDLEHASDYINGLYAKAGLPQAEYLANIELEDYGMPVDEDVSRMLGVLIRIARPKRILEIGTSVGYSTASMARVCAEYGGTILTIDYDESVVAEAKKSFERLGLADSIELQVGDAKEILPNLQESFDMIFQDVGDKNLYAILFDECVRLLSPGGLLVAEDTLFPIMDDDWEDKEGDEEESTEELEEEPDEIEEGWKDENASINQFNEMVANSPLFESTLLSIGDGLTIAFKKN